jgi:hypothetical protein
MVQVQVTYAHVEREATMALGIMKAAHLVSTLGLGVGLGLGAGISRSAAQGIPTEVAYVEAVSGTVIAFSQGKPALLDPLDTIGDRTQLDLQANSELHICHYLTHKLVTLRGPMRVLVSAGGVENANAVVSITQACAKPVVSIFQGGIASRGIGRGPVH